ncbi:MAG: ZIP family metal transporter [Oscillospiraceae bacterium]|nr:ZIP family metal transporter [Oscillospiraceae bacterium]
MTAAGSAMVFLLRRIKWTGMRTAFLGFAAGVMVAASVWSLLIPAIEGSKGGSVPEWVPAAVGFVLGGLFLLALDKITPHFHAAQGTYEGPASHMRRSWLLVSAVTLHNIPEGMAVGLSFAYAAQAGEHSALMASIALAVGIGIQNFPEGAALSIPMAGDGVPPWKSFLIGAASGIVEPIFGALAALLASRITGIMPWMLSFAAGAMVYVVAEELIPEAHSEKHEHIGTWGVMIGFLVMMVLDVALG